MKRLKPLRWEDTHVEFVVGVLELTPDSAFAAKSGAIKGVVD